MNRLERQATIINATKKKTIFSIKKYGQTVTYYIDKVNGNALITGLMNGEMFCDINTARQHYLSHR